MAKIKERKSESWKPGLLHDDGFISKNKKRKDKRMSLNLSAKKMDSDEFIPIKKSMLTMGKAKEGSSKFLSPALDKKQTPKKKDTPLPKFSAKKQNTDSAPNARKLSFVVGSTPKVKAHTPKGKVEVSNTPKSKTKVQTADTPKVKLEPAIKSSLKKKSQKFIDYEAEEGEELNTDKPVKPYEKGQKRKSISFKFDDKEEESDSDESDDDDSDNSDELTDARDFFDHEASEGEETDDESGSEEEEDEDDDDSKDNLYKSFVNGEDDLETDEEDSEDGVDDEEEGESDNDGDDDDGEESDDEEELPPKVQEKNRTDNKKKVKPAQTPTVSLNQNKKDDTKKVDKGKETPAKKIEPQANANQKDIKKEKKLKEKETSDDVTLTATSEFAGYIKFLPNTITADQIKSQLSTEISSKNIVSIVLKKNSSKNSHRGLVYVKDADSLEDLENKTFTIGKTVFKVYKARESKKPEKTKPLLFLPRVPVSIGKTKLESLIADDVGAENIVKVKNKGLNAKLNCRNVLIELANHEVLKKIIYKGSYSCDGKEIVVRQAFESGFQIPIHKVVFSGVPEKANEATIKKAVEAKVGQGTVINVKFSFNNHSFAFVALNDEQAQKKLLEPDMTISVKGTTVKVVEFKPRHPKKRGPAKKKAQEGPAAKKQKAEDSSPALKSGKSKNKKKHPKPSETSPKKQKPQQESQSPFSPSKDKKTPSQNQVPDKKANLSNKLVAKKNKLKNKKMKKKQAMSDE